MQPKQKRRQPKAEPPNPSRLTMDKVADRLQQECDLMKLLNEDLLDVITLLIEMTKIQTRQVEQWGQVNERLKWIWEKYTQIDSNMLDSATIAKLYRFMAEADGVQIVPMVYGQVVEAKAE